MHCFNLTVFVFVFILYAVLGNMLVYNKDKTFLAYVESSNASYKGLRALVTSKGLSGGLKIYLKCVYNAAADSGTIVLSDSNVCTAQKW